jgi:hypothetical protein
VSQTKLEAARSCPALHGDAVMGRAFVDAGPVLKGILRVAGLLDRQNTSPFHRRKVGFSGEIFVDAFGLPADATVAAM